MTVSQYNTCVNDLADGLYRFALKSCGDQALAEDFVQDAFERLWKKVEQVEPEKAKSYLFRTVVNLQIDTIRREKLSRAHLEQKKADYIELPVPFDVKAHLDEGIKRLNETQRNAVLLRDYEGYSYSEIAEILNVSEDQVKISIFRARKALKEFLVTIDLLI
jgi:RNA polymerase sigma factor (sigma-70 family)